MRHPVVLFFALTGVLTIPFWAVGLTGVMLMPGLPVSALGVVCPALAAIIVTRLETGRSGLKIFLRRSVSAQFHWRWWVPAVLLFPALLASSAGLMLLTGVHLPAPLVSLPSVLVLVAVFLVAGYCEELGWSGLATTRLVERHNRWWAALGIGVAWAIWHVIPFAQGHPSAEWVVWQCVQTVALRFLLVWIFTATNLSVVAATVLHASVNLGDFLFPVNGSLYDPRYVAPVVAVAAVMLIIATRSRARVPLT